MQWYIYKIIKYITFPNDRFHKFSEIALNPVEVIDSEWAHTAAKNNPGNP